HQASMAGQPSSPSSDTFLANVGLLAAPLWPFVQVLLRRSSTFRRLPRRACQRDSGSMSLKTQVALALLLGLGADASAFCQDKVFDWLAANDESVRMDPANYHTGRTYHPGPQGGGIHVDIEAQKPVTIALTSASAWDAALQNPYQIRDLTYICPREHV